MKYSFIIPVYGCERYLEACVSGILTQKGDHEYEIILVDDGSKDGSGQIADDLAKRHSNVRTFHKENGGAASARNFGLRQAAGEYILFIDGDDTVDDQLLNNVGAALDKNPDALIIFGMSFDYYQGINLVRSQILSCGHEGSISVQELLKQYKSFFYDNALSSSCNKVFSSKIIKENDLRQHEGMTLYEDYAFVLRYLSCVDSVACIAKPHYHYRNELGESHLDRRLENFEKLQENMRRLLQASEGLAADSIQLREITANLYLMLLWQHLKVRTYTAEELKNVASAYCTEPHFRKLLMPDVKLGALEESLLKRIENEDFSDILGEIRRRKRIAFLKSAAKRILRAIGLRRL